MLICLAHSCMKTHLLFACCLFPAIVVAAPPLVAVDVGHGERDTGATSARGRSEFAFNRDFAGRLASTLRQRELGVREVNFDGRIESLYARPQAANGSDFFISIHHDSIGEAWLLPYSDLMTLLLALFIALFAISQTDQKKITELSQAFSSAFNMGGPSMFDKMGPNVGRRAESPADDDKGNSAYLAENKKLEEIQKKMEDYIQQNGMSDHLSTQLTEEGLMIRIKERALFPSGSAQLVAQSQSIIPVVAGLLASVPERVVVSGHTDNMPISSSQFPSNWELSSTRAMNFMKALLASNSGLNPARFSAIGYSEYRPIADNKTDAGRAQNRRVEIFVARNYRFNPDEKNKSKQTSESDTGADGMPVAGTTGNTPSTNGSAGSGMQTTTY